MRALPPPCFGSPETASPPVDIGHFLHTTAHPSCFCAGRGPVIWRRWPLHGLHGKDQMREQPKVFWPDKSQFTGNFKDRRTSQKVKSLTPAADACKRRRLDNSIHSAEKTDLRLGRVGASFSEEELSRQCEALAARFAAAPALLVPAASEARAIKLTPDAIGSVVADIGGPPWD